MLHLSTIQLLSANTLVSNQEHPHLLDLKVLFLVSEEGTAIIQNDDL